MNKSITVQATDVNERLDKFLVGRLDLSRSQIAKHIQSGAIMVNGSAVTKHYAVQKGDKIVVNIEEEKVEIVPVDIPILHEDDAIVVIDKPVGVLVHPTPNSAEWTLADFAREHGAEGVGDAPERPGIVHRLDRAVSGVMVIAKTQEAFESLKAQFKARTVRKEYRAIVFGVPVHETDVIKFKIAHSKTQGGKMAARPEDAEGRDAWTEYDVLQNINDRFAELSVRIRTGRTHQIRAHFAAIDHPIVGDHLYASNHYKSKKEYPRLMLHSYELEFAHPESGAQCTFTAPLPQELQSFTA